MKNINVYYINGKLNNQRLKESYLKLNENEVYNSIVEFHSRFFNDIDIKFNFSQKVYNYENDILEYPICSCGKTLQYINFKKGYQLNCSIKCSANNKATVEKRSNSIIESGGYTSIVKKRQDSIFKKYGVVHQMHSEDIKDKIKKTNLERYGSENVYGSEIIKDKIKKTNLIKFGVENSLQSQEIKNRIKQTNIERYGHEYALQSNECMDKLRKTNLEKYGTEYVLQSINIKNKIKDTNLEKYGHVHHMKNDEIKNKVINSYIESTNNRIIDRIEGYCKFIKRTGHNIDISCNTCGNISNVQSQFIISRISKEITPCIHCVKINYNNYIKESQIYDFIKSIYAGTIIQSDRKLLSGKELDIYLPELNLAFEFNGLYWHSELYKGKNYHLDKTNQCKEQGIQLIHIWEDDWEYKRDIVKSIIRNKLRLTENKIFARKCMIKELSSKQVKEFLNHNHIQGSVNSKYNIGLYYGGELVSIMTFSQLRKNLGQHSIDGHFELLRFCNKLNLSVIGGASKLFKHFIKTYNPVNVISYASLDRSNGNLYEKLGFAKLSNSKPGYHYIVNNTREYRFNYRKDILVKQGYDKTLTESEIMFAREIYRIYDCGNLKYEYSVV